MGVLTADYADYWKDTGYTSTDTYYRPPTLETYVEYDAETKRYVTRIGTKPEPEKHADDLADWERELLYGDSSGCQCGLCRMKQRDKGPVAVNTKCNDCGKLETKVLRLTDELADAKRQRDEYDAEASALAKELERLMTARDELLAVLDWYEATE